MTGNENAINARADGSLSNSDPGAAADKYAGLRAALDAGPTPGPWITDQKTSEHYAYCGDALGSAVLSVDDLYTPLIDSNQKLANISYAAAANPEAIRALLAERDALRAALEGAWTHIAQLPPTQDRVEVARMVCAALAQEQA